MLTIEVRFLTGRYTATRFNDRARAEWPPHPARVFSALVAALHDAPEPSASERDALRWLAAGGAPDVIASTFDERQQGAVYVPPNDGRALADMDAYIQAVGEAESQAAGTDGSQRAKAEKSLARAQARLLKRSIDTAAADGKGTPKNAALVLNPRLAPQPRRFPTTIPHEEVVHFRWRRRPSEQALLALDRVASRVARLGHSSSLVCLRAFDGDVMPGARRTWTPDPVGRQILRVPLAGQLDLLEEAHARHRQVEQRTLPAEFVRYVDCTEQDRQVLTLGSAFSTEDWLIFEIVAPPDGGRRLLLDLSLAQHVARAIRGTLIRAVDGVWPEALSGHTTDGGPSQRPHLAFVPLADVGHPYATGTILGVALIPPRDLLPGDRRALLRAVASAEAEGTTPDDDPLSPPALRLVLGARGVLHVRRILDQPATNALRAKRWTGPSARWASATAAALDRNPGNLRSRDPDVVLRAVADAEAQVAASCVNVGLPEPAAVWVHPRSLFQGAPAAHRFMPFPASGNGPRRVCVHAEILFHESVSGPLLLGAGRYLGLGLCVPSHRGDNAR